MCDDMEATIRDLKGRNVPCSPIIEERWGRLTRIALPGGGEVGLYQPKHPTALRSA